MGQKLPLAMLFDLDGTLVDYNISRDSGWRQAVKECSNLPGSIDPDNLVERIVKTAEWFWSDEFRNATWRRKIIESRREIARITFSDLGIQDSSLSDGIADKCTDIREKTVTLIAGATDTLARLKDEGIPLALITNGARETQRAKITRFGLDKIFETVLVEGEIGYGKPDERIYRLALKSLEIGQPENAWMVGDNIVWDVISPQRIGIKGFWVNPNNAKNPYEEQPYRTIQSVKDLLMYL